MKKCINCFFFKNKFPVYDTKFSCSELFITEDMCCSDFTLAARKSSISDTKKTEYLEALPSFSNQQDFMNVITDIFSMDRDAVTVIDEIRKEIDAQGYDLPFQASKVLALSGKLSDLYLLYRLTLSHGLGAFSDQIMKLHIEKLFFDPRKAQNTNSEKSE